THPYTLSLHDALPIFIQGYATTLYDLDWSPDGKELASVGSDTEVCLWEVEGRKPPRVLRGHTWTVYGVAWRPDGRLLATSGWDRSEEHTSELQSPCNL